jgi:hypothetical protein
VLESPADKHRAVALTFDEFHYSFTSTMNDEDAMAGYERYAAPGRVPWEGARTQRRCCSRS